MHICNMVHGLPHLKSFLPIYESCIFGKHSQFPYPTTLITRATTPLALIHIELYGLMGTPSFNGALYFLIFVDDYSRYTHIYFLHKKLKHSHILLSIKLLLKIKPIPILILHFDNGVEFTYNQFNKFWPNNGHWFTNPYNLAQNGVSKHKNHTAIEYAWNMFETITLIKLFSAKGLYTSCYIQNCSYTLALKNITSIELWINLKPSFIH
jgi:histone deacetylase 1/2